MKRHCILAFCITLTTALIAACTRQSDLSDQSVAGQAARALPVSGERKGDFFYPQFQRWRIVEVTPVAGRPVPADLGGVPAILRGKSFYLNAGYMTMPSLNYPGDSLFPACFKQSQNGLEIWHVTARTGASREPMIWRSEAGNRMRFQMEKLFDLTLERIEPPPDEGDQQRTFDAHFNQQLAQERELGLKTDCELQPAGLPALAHGDLELIAPATGRRIILEGGDLDPKTPITASSMSYEWRRPLDPKLPSNTLGGCVGRQLVMRLRSGDSPGSDAVGQYQILGGVLGQSSDGEICERAKFLRRIEPDRVLELLDIAVPREGLDALRPVSMELTEWTGDGVFSAKVGRAEVEFSGVDQPQIMVTLLSRGAEPVASYPQPLSAAPALPIMQPAVKPEPDSERGKTMHKWVDENGVVNYSDQPRPR